MDTSKIRSTFHSVFACDLRSLAVLRIALGSMLLVELAMRCFTMEAMYTDAGFFPVEDRNAYVQLLSNSAEPISWSIHAWSGTLEWQIALFVLAAIAAGFMIVGRFTRVATIVSWVLLTSLQMRNPLILHSGDCLFRLAMFWSMFLPLGAVWSLDSKGKEVSGRTNPVSSGATFGFILTLCSLYLFAGIAKINSVWLSGDAMAYVLRLDIYATSFGKLLLDSPWILKLVTWATLAAEVILPILLLSPWKNSLWRRISLLVFVALHLSIAACMSIGLFSWIAISCWMALVPGNVWDRLLPKRKLPESATSTHMSFSPWAKLANAFCLLIAGYFLLWNIATIESPGFHKAMPQQARFVGKWLNTRQAFRMFDVPPKYSPWFVYQAKLQNGAEVDIFRASKVDHERPESVLATIPQHHWRRLHRNLARPAFERFRKPVSEYLIRNWNESHDEDSQIEWARTTAYLDEINPHGPFEGQVVQVWHQYGGESADSQMFDDLLKKMKKKGIILP